MARIYQAETMGEADLRVALVTDRGRADLLVNRVGSYGLAVGDALWFITHRTTRRHQRFATKPARCRIRSARASVRTRNWPMPPPRWPNSNRIVRCPI